MRSPISRGDRPNLTALAKDETAVMFFFSTGAGVIFLMAFLSSLIY